MFGRNVLLNVVSQGFFGNDGLSCNRFCIGLYLWKAQVKIFCVSMELGSLGEQEILSEFKLFQSKFFLDKFS